LVLLLSLGLVKPQPVRRALRATFETRGLTRASCGTARATASMEGAICGAGQGAEAPGHHSAGGTRICRGNLAGVAPW
jgi:hypothetical protein